MASYNDYNYILTNYNFGGLSGIAQPNVSNDPRAAVSLDVNGKYQFNYFILSSMSDLDSLGYYDTPNNDLNNDNQYWDGLP